MDDMKELATGYIHLCFPFSCEHPLSYFAHLDKTHPWEPLSYQCYFFLKHIKNIFKNHTHCYKKTTPTTFYYPIYTDTALQYGKIENAELQLFFFESFVGIAVAKIDVGSMSLSETENLNARLRIASSNPQKDEAPYLYDVVRAELAKIDPTALLFNHQDDAAQHRCDSFVAVVRNHQAAPAETPEEVAIKLSEGYNAAYTMTKAGDSTEIYTPSANITWAFSPRGVGAVAQMLPDQAEPRNNHFLVNKWIASTQDGYFLSFILTLHQKYATFHMLCLMESEQNGQKTQKKLIDFKTVYFFKILSGEPFYQNAYTRMLSVMNIESILEDLNDELRCQTEYSEMDANRHNNTAGFIISLVCGVSVLFDTLSFATEHGFRFSDPLSIVGILTYGALLLECALFAVGICFFKRRSHHRKNTRDNKS